jgi:hypothetical protein
MMTVEEMKALALKHYNDGGDTVYECWDRKDYEEIINHYGDETEWVFRRMIGASVLL